MEPKTKERPLPKGISKRADGRYQGRFTFQGERFTLYDRDLKTLQKKMADVRYEMEHGIYLNSPHMTLNTFFETWLSEIKENTLKFIKCISPLPLVVFRLPPSIN